MNKFLLKDIPVNSRLQFTAGNVKVTRALRSERCTILTAIYTAASRASKGFGTYPFIQRASNIYNFNCFILEISRNLYNRKVQWDEIKDPV